MLLKEFLKDNKIPRYMRQTANSLRQTASGKRLTVISLLFVLAFAFSCEEEFDITAPYQDITVVYGLVDPGDDTIYLKINKAFLGEGNTLEMAKIEDSSVYVNGLSAVIEEWENGSMLKSYTLDTITIDNKEDGVFYNPYQVIYYTPYQPVTSREYRLKIDVNGREVTAATELIRNFSIEKPSSGTKFIQFKPDTDGDVVWISAKEGRRYEVVMRFNFKEVLLNSPDTVFRYIDWALGTRKSVTVNGGEEMSVGYSNDSFYDILAEGVPYDDPSVEANVAERFTNNVDVFVAVAAEEFNTYMEVNEPSNSIVQDRPDYTNVVGGIGLFSSRFRNSRTKKVHPESVQEIKTQLPALKFVF